MPIGSKITRYLTFDPRLSPIYNNQTIGSGKVGGKARGLLFAQQILRQSNNPLFNRVTFPVSYFIATGVFDDFITQNQLQHIAESGRDFKQIEAAFMKGSFSPAVRNQLAALINHLPFPFTVRSSSLLEDNLRCSFAGKYLTTFVSNTGNYEDRLAALETAIKRVFASIYSPNAIEYRRKHNLHGDKMAVLIQQLAGKERGLYFYPEIAGVGFSKNYRRWSKEVNKEDGVIRLVFGLGTRCVGREYARTFSLTDLNLRPEGSNPWTVATYSQERFDVLSTVTNNIRVFNINHKLDIIKYHPCFHEYAQIYRAEDERIEDIGTQLPVLGPGDKVVLTFQNFVKSRSEFFRLVQTLMIALEEELGLPVDIEFTYEPEDKLFTLVQMRPLPSYEEYRAVQVPRNLPADNILLKGSRMLASGVLLGVTRLVYVDPYLYQQAEDKLSVAREVARLNRLLEGERYILVGPGRWGSTKAELGVPVNYNQISNAGLIVELGIRAANFVPELPYGTRFFHDLEVDNILYLSVSDTLSDNRFNSAWFRSRAAFAEPTGHPVVSIYSGIFNAYLDSERREGCVTTHN
ncbi:MAG: phosphoenolpyruvate synthase [Firmicutes bacterium]|jgi:hypothetical protein|nr:phosphoenolpyruvate synthase [Bacillota bacterium]